MLDRSSGEVGKTHVYVDESIHTDGEFICTALVFSTDDLQEPIADVLQKCGLQPGIDEFKSSRTMVNNPSAKSVRDGLKHVLYANQCKIALSFRHISERDSLGPHVHRLLMDVVGKRECGEVLAHFDVGILGRNFISTKETSTHLLPECDSRKVYGIQLADMCAHSAAVAVKCRAGISPKEVRAGEGSGYDPEMLISLDFELWATMRYSLASNEMAPPPKGRDREYPAPYLQPFGLDVGPLCRAPIKEAAHDLFGLIYLGCIH
jgi:hypothetical protein